MVRNLIFVLCLVVTGLGIYNVYGPTAEVDRLAAAAACPSPNSSCALRAVERTPFSHSLHYQSRGRMVDVSCKREMVLLGAWKCTRTLP